MPDTPSTPPPTAAPQTGAPPPRSLPERALRYRRLWMLAVLTFAADQLTKLWIARLLPDPRHPPATYRIADGAREIIPGFFHLVHVGNPGAAWSMLSGQGVLLGTLACATLIAIFYWRRTLGLYHPTSQIAFGLLCGGIAGNLVDRLRLGYVIDFIDLHFGSYAYPSFNIADSGICIGVVLYLWQSLKQPDADKAKDTGPRARD